MKKEVKKDIIEDLEESEEGEKETAEEVSKDVKEKQNKQLRWAVILMISVIVITIAVPVIVNKFFNSFEYINLDFQKTHQGKIIFYSTKIPLVDKAPAIGYITPDQITGTYSINFRNDPRKLKDIKMKVSENMSSDIKFIKSNIVYISLNPNMERCDDNSLALMNLASFLKTFAGIEMKAAYSDKNLSTETIPYVTCENNSKNTVIEVDSSDMTEITKINDNCYKLTYSDCEITQLTEKFQLILLDKYMSYFS